MLVFIILYLLGTAFLSVEKKNGKDNKVGSKQCSERPPSVSGIKKPLKHTLLKRWREIDNLRASGTEYCFLGDLLLLRAMRESLDL